MIQTWTEKACENKKDQFDTHIISLLCMDMPLERL